MKFSRPLALLGSLFLAVAAPCASAPAAAAPAAEPNPLYRRGALRLSEDRRHSTHADGTPFFWLADSWWFGITRRLRYVIAGYGAHPVVWTLAGESTLVYYVADARRADLKTQVAGWAEVARDLRAKDPFQRLLTVHPGPSSGRFRPLDDMSLLDFVFLQPGHSDWETLPQALEHQARARKEFPRQPSLMGEVCFEGMHGGGSGPRIQRYLFWSTVLSGAPGFSYGTGTTWQFNRRDEPFGASPHGMAWGNTPWEEGYLFAGSTHVGLGRRILAEVEWWRLEPHQEWISPAATPADFMKPFCAGIPGELRVIFLPKGQPRWGPKFKLRALDPGVRYSARYVDPITGRTEASITVTPGSAGEWPLAYPPILQDWVLIVRAEK